ncbi:MAG: patatin-like phospholipase family protein [Myxococcota bacterium]
MPRSVVALVLAGLVVTSHARAAEPTPLAATPSASRVAPLGLVVHGAASLGSFEAGALYYLTALLAKNPALVAPRVVTGTSAGAINGLITAMTTCGSPAASPVDSAYFRTWIPVGLGGLFDPKKVTATSAFNREGAMAEVARSIRALWDAGLDARCDIVFGVPVTRVDPRRVGLDADARLPILRAEERFVVRIRGRGPGVPPSVTNWVDAGAGEAALLATDERGEVAFDAIVELLFASSGVPVAFAPVQLHHCVVMIAPHEGPPICRGADLVEADLVDGGFLDNQPLRLAARLVASGLDDAGQLLAAPDRQRATLPPEASFLAIDPLELPWAPLPEPTRKASLADLVSRLVPGLLGSARTAELQALFDAHPEVGRRVGVLQSDWPTASAPLGAFFGFVERDFRVFDFYLGMHEGRRLADVLVAPWAASRGLHVVLPDPGTAAAADGWAPYRCLRAMLDGDGLSTACAVSELGAVERPANFLALLQTSLDRLYGRCRMISEATAAALPTAPVADARARCRAAHDGAAPPDVPGVQRDPDWRAGRDEPAHEVALRRLTAHRFDFHDLGIGRADATRARRRLASVIGEISDALAAAQPEDRLLWHEGARLLAQSIAYRPPAHALHILAGATLDLAWSVTDPDGCCSGVRFIIGAEIDGLSSLLDGEAPNYFALSPMAGLELEPVGLGSAAFQLRFGLRAGFRFSTGDGFSTDRADPTPDVPRSRPVAELYVAGILIQWVRLQVGAAWYPAFDGLAASVDGRSMLGIELDLPL